MRETARDIGGKLLAIGVLLAAAYVLFKVVLGFAAWLLVGVLAVVAILWALNRVL